LIGDGVVVNGEADITSAGAINLGKNTITTDSLKLVANGGGVIGAVNAGSDGGAVKVDIVANGEINITGKGSVELLQVKQTKEGEPVSIEASQDLVLGNDVYTGVIVDSNGGELLLKAIKGIVELHGDVDSGGGKLTLLSNSNIPSPAHNMAFRLENDITVA
jgi:hypothetical protein